MSSSRDVDLANPEAALASYLDELLHTATGAAREDDLKAKEEIKSAPEPAKIEARPEPAAVVNPTPKSKPKPVAQTLNVAAKPKPILVAEPKPAPVPKLAEPAPSTVAKPDIAQPIETVADVAKTPDVPAGGSPVGRPEWSESPFECLIFRVAGLQLAVPLILLGAIHRLEEGIKPIPGSPRWYMGMLPGKEHNLRVVDSAEWIMAGRVPTNARENYRFVIRLDNSEWALACDDVAQSFTLNPDEVRWRTSRSKRPWLAGTVIKQMCALIDVGTMAELLAQAEREHHLNIE